MKLYQLGYSKFTKVTIFLLALTIDRLLLMTSLALLYIYILILLVR